LTYQLHEKAKSPAPFYIKTKSYSKKINSSRARDIDTILIIVYYRAFVNRFFEISFVFGKIFFTLFSEYAKMIKKDTQKYGGFPFFRGIDKPIIL
jgi:hypothetical protein